MTSALYNVFYVARLNRAFTLIPRNESFFGISLIPSDPPCGCGPFTNADDIEGNIALVTVWLQSVEVVHIGTILYPS